MLYLEFGHRARGKANSACRQPFCGQSDHWIVRSEGSHQWPPYAIAPAEQRCVSGHSCWWSCKTTNIQGWIQGSKRNLKSGLTAKMLRRLRSSRLPSTKGIFICLHRGGRAGKKIEIAEETIISHCGFPCRWVNCDLPCIDPLPFWQRDCCLT